VRRTATESMKEAVSVSVLAVIVVGVVTVGAVAWVADHALGAAQDRRLRRRRRRTGGPLYQRGRA